MTAAVAKVRVADHHGVPVAAIEGEVDIANGDDVQNQLVDAVRHGADGLVVDLSGTIYLDSTGVRVLLALNNRLGRRGQRLRVVVPATSMVRRILVLSSLEDDIPLDHTVEEAVGFLREPR